MNIWMEIRLKVNEFMSRYTFTLPFLAIYTFATTTYRFLLIDS